ncbi:hypothetical protein GF373_02215 [bacterium]|nr:hypothetical protein [bacterium]
MSEEKVEQGFQQRFYRDGAPYFRDFELVVSQLFDNEGPGNKAVAHATVDLMKGIHAHLAECQKLLGETEALVEKARDENEPQEKIDDLVNLCLNLQQLQTGLSDKVTSCVNNFVDEIFPR